MSVGKSCYPSGPGNGGRLFERPPIFGYDLIVRSVAASWNGSALATFPQATRIAGTTIQFDTDTGLVGMVLVTSVINPITSSICGIFAAYDVGAAINLSGGDKVFIGSLTQQNSNIPPAIPVPTNKSVSLSFGENSAIRMNSKQAIAIYATGTAQVTQLYAATLHVYTILLDKGASQG